MGVRVGSARSNENGGVNGGKAGDQTGREVSTQLWYLHSKGWIVIRAKAPAVREAIAKNMEAACQNDNIGYCQGHRSDVVTKLRQSGSLANITAKSEADCSALVRACCIQAGFDPGNFNTANECAALNRTKQFMDRIPVTAGTMLYNGDILVTKTKGHTVIVVSGNPRKAASSNTVTSNVRVDAAQHKDSSLAGTYTTTSDFHIRAGIGKASLAIMPSGSKFQNFGYYNLDKSKKKWLYGVYTDKAGNKITGYASAAYLRK